MRASDIQLRLIIRGLYRKGHRSLSIKEIYELTSRLEVPGGVHVELRRVRRFLAPKRGLGWDVWHFIDRLSKAVGRLEKKGEIKVTGKRCTAYPWSINAEVELRDYTNTEVYGNDRLRMLVMPT